MGRAPPQRHLVRSFVLLGLAALPGAGSCEGEGCVPGEARCEGDVPVNCYREHNERDEFDPAAWHRGEACLGDYACVLVPTFAGRSDARCVFGGAPYAPCPTRWEGEPESLCDGGTLVHCLDGYRVADEACPAGCEPLQEPGADLLRAGCIGS